MAIIILALAMGLVGPQGGLGVAQALPTEQFPVTISLGDIERVFFANHTSNKQDGNWIELGGGTSVKLPSLKFVYEGPDIAYTRGGVTVTMESDFIPELVNYPLSTHRVYEEGDPVSATFWGSPDLDKSVSFRLLQASSFSELIDDFLNKDFWGIIGILDDIQVWSQKVTLDPAGDKTVNLYAPAAGDYLLVVAKMDLNPLNPKFYLYSATAIEVVDDILTVSTPSSVEGGDPVNVNSKLASEPTGSYIHVAAMIKESAYSGEIKLTTDNTVPNTEIYLNGELMADGSLFTDFFLGTKDQSYITIDLIEEKLMKAFDPDELAFGYTTATHTGSISLSTSSLATGDYFLLVGVWEDFETRIVGLKQTTVTVKKYTPPVNEKPVADAGPDQMAYVGETVYFSGEGSYDPDGTIVGYEWTFGDGDTTSGEEVSHSYSEADSYTVTLTVEDNKGAEDTDTCTVTVTEAPPETGTLTIYTEHVKGEVFVDGESWGISPQTRELETGLYDVSFGEVSGYVTPDPVEAEVKVNETTNVLGTYTEIPPDMGILNVDTKPVKGEVFVNGTSWGTAPKSQVVAVGSYTVSFGEVAGYVTPESINAVVKSGLTTNVLGTYTAEKQPPVADAGGPYYGKPRVTVNFDGTWSYDPDGEIISYAWDFGDGTTGEGPTVSHIYYSTKTYTVTLNVTDNDDLTDTETTTAKISKPSPPPTPPPNKDPKADAGPNQKISLGSSIHLSGAGSYDPDPDGKIVSYRWKFGDGTTATGPEVDHTYSEPGQYTVTLTVKDNEGAEDSDKCNIMVWKPPAPVKDKFGQLVPGEQKGFKVNASEEANTIITLDTTNNVTVTVLKYDDNPHPGDPLPATALQIYVDVEVSDPDAVVWPIYVEIFYTDEQAEGLDESTFGIYYWMDGAWQRCSDTGVDTVLNVVWAYMTAEEASGSPILIAGMHAIPTPPLPPFFSNLIIAPEELELWDNVTISFDIMNPNDGAISYGFEMQIGELNFPLNVELEAYESKTVSRTIFPTAIGTYNVTVMGMTGNFTVKAPPKPAEFVVSDLSITPEEFELGEGVDVWSFRVTVNVENVGEQEGTHTVDLKVDGDVIQDGTVILWGGEETMIVFDVTRGVGSYTVEVAGLTGSFTVTAYPKPPEFEVSDLAITPDEIELGDEVTISFIITNTDSRSCVFVPFVQIGDTMLMEGVELEGHESRTVSHTITPESAGDYDVTIDGLEGSFTVKPKPKAPFWMRPGYAAGILIIIVSAGAIIYLNWKGKLRPLLSPDST